MNRNMIVDLDIDFRGNQNGLQQTTVSYTHRYEDDPRDQELNTESSHQQSQAQSIPTKEDFPQLAISASSATGSSSNYAVMAKNVTSLKKTNFSSKFQSPTSNSEDFPALASGSSTSTAAGSGGLPSFAQKKLLTVKPKQPLNKKGNASTNNNQQRTSNLKYADIASSFPPLSTHLNVNESWNKPLPTFTQDDFPDMPIKMKKTKKKTQYINVQKEAEKAKKQKEEEEAKKQKENELNGTLDANQQQQNTISNNPLTNDGKMISLKVPPKLHNLQQTSIKNPPPGFAASNKSGNNQASSSSSNNNKNQTNQNAFDMNSLNNMANELINSENSKHKETNDNKQHHLPSSQRTGYLYPSNFNERNENLLKLVRQELRTDHKFDQFRTLTDKFIRSHIDGDFYFRKCLDLFDKSFLASIFSELLVLMPHIKKQTDILTAYERYFNYNKGAQQKQSKDGSKGIWILTNEKIEFLVCPNCGQVS